MYLENVSELILGWHNEYNARTSIVDVEGAVEVHHPVLGASSGDGLLDLGPLSVEISERPRLDDRPASEFNGVSVELNSHLMMWPLAPLLWRMSPRGNSVTTAIL